MMSIRLLGVGSRVKRRTFFIVAATKTIIVTLAHEGANSSMIVLPSCYRFRGTDAHGSRWKVVAGAL
jgi:hypothetical protein